MALCEKCGTKAAEGVKFCPSCGAPLKADTANQQTKSSTVQEDLSARIAALNDTADTTGEFEQNDINNNKTMSILAYLGPLCLIPLFAAKESKFARFHTNQGLLLAIACIAWSIVYGILNRIILAVSWRLYFISSIIGLLSLVFLFLCIIGIVNAANGKAKELPVIGKFKILK